MLLTIGKFILKFFLVILIIFSLLHFSISESSQNNRQKLSEVFNKIISKFHPDSLETNLLQNHSFEDNFTDPLLPDKWKVNGLKLDNSEAFDKDLSLSSKQTGKSNIIEAHQEILRLWTPDTTLEFSGWAKTNRALSDNSTGNYTPKMRLEITVYYLDGSIQSSFTNFNPQKTTWQQAITTIKLKKFAYKIIVTARYNQQTGIISLDNFYLRKINTKNSLP